MGKASRTIFLFEKCDIALAVLSFKELAVNAVFAILNAASLYQNSVNILL